MFTFTTLVCASGTLIASSVADRILVSKGKQDLAETLQLLTHMGAVGYTAYFFIKLIQSSAIMFL
jgi:hypothetical protein